MLVSYFEIGGWTERSSAVAATQDKTKYKYPYRFSINYPTEGTGLLNTGHEEFEELS